ncbi:MAG: hypothetical protein ACYDBB_20155 [Armatimonadota bacterium]
MRTIIFCSLALLCGLPAFSQAWRPADVKAKPGRFFLGVVTGIAAHEAGHVLVAKVKDIPVRLHGFSIVYPGAVMTDSDHLQVASAGYQAQWIVSEIVLRKYEAQETKGKMDPFQAGIVVSHIAISAAYLTVLKNNEEGDLVGISQATDISTNKLAVLLAIPAALDLWRLTGKDVPKWVPNIAAGYKGAAVAAIWRF